MDILKRYGEWLDDTIINAAQQLLKQQFSGKKGFQNTLLSQRLQFEVATHNSIQIHHVHNYWLTTSSDEEGNVHIYDSLVRYKLSGQLKQQIASIYRTDQTEMKVSIEAVQQQKGPSNCGLFAVAFAFDIAAGVDPQNINYIQAEMGEHLLSCLCKGNITPFPRYFGKTASVRKCKPSVVRFRVYCICRQTECLDSKWYNVIIAKNGITLSVLLTTNMGRYFTAQIVENSSYEQFCCLSSYGNSESRYENC